MLNKRLITLGVLVFLLLVSVACSGQTLLEPGANLSNTGGMTDQAQGENDPEMLEGTNQTEGANDPQASGGEVISSDGDTPVQSGGVVTSGGEEGDNPVQPGVAEGQSGEGTDPVSPSDPEQTTGQGVSSVSVENWVAYNEPGLGFSVSHPSNFVIRPVDPATFSELSPQPAGVVNFLDPAIANSEVAEFEIPDLSVRVFQLPAGSALEAWLESTGMGSAASASFTTYQASNAAGVQVCAAMDIFPNCSVYFISGDRVYQLTAGSEVGEAMLRTFAVTG